MSGGLFAKYALLLATLVGAALVASGAIEMYFSFQENQSALARLQREKAAAAATRIEQFFQVIETQLERASQPPGAPVPIDRRHADYLRLLGQAAAITELSYLDASGREQVRVSRLAPDVLGSEADHSRDPRFQGARAAGTYFGPVYFRDESEPYLSMAVAERRPAAGVVAAEVNLKFIVDVVSRIRVGTGGYAYAVDPRGRLITHPDMSLVLRRTDLLPLPQVSAAVSQATGAVMEGDLVGRDPEGRPVISASVPVRQTGWLVFVDQPLDEAFAPLRASLLRSGLLLLFGLAAAMLASLVLARRMVGPIQALRGGAARIGAGDFEHRIEVPSGDELGALAEQFNRMGEQLRRMERLERLRRFLAPQVAELVIASEDDGALETHRREVAVVFCDLRGFTAFSDGSEPEEVMAVLRQYHAALGELIHQFEGTLEQFSGDGLMVFFNDPLPCPDPAARAVRMAVAMRDRVEELKAQWGALGFQLGFGVGIAKGYATLGRIGFEGRYDYAAIGTVCNLASRLCGEARDGQILIDQRAYAEVKDLIVEKPVPDLTLKGFARPIPALNVAGLRDDHSAEVPAIRG